jgi:hypothetical protein
MKGLRVDWVVLAVAIAGCSAPPRSSEPPPVSRVQPPAPRYVETPRERMGGKAAPLDQAASDRFLQEQIARRAAAPPIKEPMPAPAPEVRYHELPGGYRYAYPHRYGYRRYGGWYGATPVAWNTALGAGLGAVIGHQDGKTWEGAAIGGGVGLLLDWMRWGGY